jgi:ketosteroid isomerase-like protein
VSSEDSKKIVREFLETFSRGDVEGVVVALDDGATWWVLGSIEGLSGTYSREEMANLLPNFTNIYKNGALELTPTSMIAEGDKVAVEADGHAELNNGRVYESKYHFLFETEGDKVKAVKEYLDTHHAHAIFFT